MICPKCGTPNADSAKFCNECGAPLRGIEASAAVTDAAGAAAGAAAAGAAGAAAAGAAATGAAATGAAGAATAGAAAAGAAATGAAGAAAGAGASGSSAKAGDGGSAGSGAAKAADSAAKNVPVTDDVNGPYDPTFDNISKKQRKKNIKVNIESEKDIVGQKVTKNIFQCPDGVYRWVYELAMLKNPSILFTTWKVLGLSLGIVFLLITVISLFTGDLNMQTFLFDIKLLGILAVVIFFLSIIAYIIVAAMYGWKYVVVFEMNDTMIKHIQIASQHKKAEVLGLITALVGLAAKRPTTIGVGLNAASRSEMVSTFDIVRTVRCYPSRNLIKVNERLFKNQVYAEDEDYEFVRDFIVSHCKNAKIF